MTWSFYTEDYLHDIAEIAKKLNRNTIERMVEGLAELKRHHGRLFLIGNGGSAANASHAVNDFRKIVGIQAFTPTDNVAELTARINDFGWAASYGSWLSQSGLTPNDMVFVLSVGGGGEHVSQNIVQALNYAIAIRCPILGIVGSPDGMTAKTANACLIILDLDEDTVTPYTESFQSVILHLLVTHPGLRDENIR
jgi:D-sedoheptulose 7-phosphate isomerase